jgi:hypothetical protein
VISDFKTSCDQISLVIYLLSTLFTDYLPTQLAVQIISCRITSLVVNTELEKKIGRIDPLLGNDSVKTFQRENARNNRMSSGG